MHKIEEVGIRKEMKSNSYRWCIDEQPNKCYQKQNQEECDDVPLVFVPDKNLKHYQRIHEPIERGIRSTEK